MVHHSLWLKQRVFESPVISCLIQKKTYFILIVEIDLSKRLVIADLCHSIMLPKNKINLGRIQPIARTSFSFSLRLIYL